MRQLMLILPGKGKRLPTAGGLRKAGFLVSAAMDGPPGQTARGPGETATGDGREETDGTETSCGVRREKEKCP